MGKRYQRKEEDGKKAGSEQKLIVTQAHSRPLLCITPICSPLLPLTYISFLPTADVVEAEVLDTEALLRLVKTPQPLALHRPPLALPALATPEVPQRGKRDKERGSGHNARGQSQ